MILSALTVEELLRYPYDPEISEELMRRFQTQELYTHQQMIDIEEIAYGNGLDVASTEVIGGLIDLLDGEHWKEAVDEDTREWMKVDLYEYLRDNLGDH